MGHAHRKGPALKKQRAFCRSLHCIARLEVIAPPYRRGRTTSSGHVEKSPPIITSGWPCAACDGSLFITLLVRRGGRCRKKKREGWRGLDVGPGGFASECFSFSFARLLRMGYNLYCVGSQGLRETLGDVVHHLFLVLLVVVAEVGGIVRLGVARVSDGYGLSRGGYGLVPTLLKIGESPNATCLTPKGHRRVKDRFNGRSDTAMGARCLVADLVSCCRLAPRFPPKPKRLAEDEQNTRHETVSDGSASRLLTTAPDPAAARKPQDARCTHGGAGSLPMSQSPRGPFASQQGLRRSRSRGLCRPALSHCLHNDNVGGRWAAKRSLPHSYGRADRAQTFAQSSDRSPGGGCSTGRRCPATCLASTALETEKALPRGRQGRHRWVNECLLSTWEVRLTQMQRTCQSKGPLSMADEDRRRVRRERCHSSSTRKYSTCLDFTPLLSSSITTFPTHESTPSPTPSITSLLSPPHSSSAHGNHCSESTLPPRLSAAVWIVPDQISLPRPNKHR